MLLSHRHYAEHKSKHKNGAHSIDVHSQSPLELPPQRDNSGTIVYDDGFDQKFSQRRRLYGNNIIDKDFMIVSPKLKYNQHVLPEYQNTLKYNIITGAEEEDKLPPLPSVRVSLDASQENLLMKQREVDQILKRMRQQRELVNGVYVK